MDIKEAFNDLLTNWSILAPEDRQKYRVAKSKYINGTGSVSEGMMREILIKAGYLENWKKPKKH